MGSNKEIVDPVLDVYQIDTILGVICLKNPATMHPGHAGPQCREGLAGVTHPGFEVADPSRFVLTLDAPQAAIGQKTITEGLVLCR